AGFIVAIVFFVLSYMEKLRADKQFMIAQEQKIIADEQRGRAESQTLIAEKNALLAESRGDSQIARENALRLALVSAHQARQETEQALIEANTRRSKAEEQTARTNDALEDVRIQFNRAEANYQDARRQYLLAIAQSLSAKAVQENDDSNLAGLLAMQGYHFHRRYDGRVYDPYIYEGLYSSLTKVNGLTYNAIKVPGPPHVHIKSLVLSPRNNGFYTAGVDGRIMKGSVGDMTTVATPYSN